MPASLIITADDFGRSHQINHAVILAHQRGVLTSASLMVAGQAAAEAVELARHNPALAVGLHLVLVDGPAVLPPSRIRHLVDANGQFANAPFRLGLRYMFGAAARRELAAEIEAQFARFVQTGLAMSHVDGHQHMHLHPAVLALLLPLAQRYGARGIRLTRDRVGLALSHNRRRACREICPASALGLLSRWAARRVSRRGLHSVTRTYGLLQSGQISEAYVLDVLAELERTGEPTAEIYLHPTLGPRVDALGPNPDELEVLLSPRVRQMIGQRRVRLSTYASLHD